MSEALLLSLPVLLPGGACAVLGAGWLLGWRMREAPVAALSASCYGAVLLALAGLWGRLLDGGGTPLRAEYGDWLAIGGHGFPLSLWADRVSLPLLTLSALLLGVVALFSRRYMHRDPGYLRFFTLLNLFGAGILLLFSAGSFGLLVVGWELVGLTSVLLVAFFQHRDEPARGALRVLAVYRFCDLGLLAGVALMHSSLGSTEFARLLPGPHAAAVAGLLLLAAMGKSAQAPFSGWLPRAMEGPTPSSAIFYGALSLHAGAYLLLRTQPLLDSAPAVERAVVAVGLLTALQATLAGRACPDAKNSLAYASMTQLGIVFVEIGLGWERLALWHIAGHALLRTAQFLRAPSMLHDHHLMHSAAGGRLGSTEVPLPALLPRAARAWLYRLALERCHQDVLLDRLLVRPAEALARRLRRAEMGWSAHA